MSNLYDTDVVAWSEQQAALLGRMAAGERIKSTELDWPKIAEEIDALGKSSRRRLRGHIAMVLEHLIRLQGWPAIDPRNGWKASLRHDCHEIEQDLDDSPSPRRDVAQMILIETHRARKDVAVSLREYDEQPQLDIDGLTFTEEQVLGDWFPESPTTSL
ncbi:DUF29 domain-containing protein [Rhodopila sp.]|uniref:DUF29 domain-containing protein n=1 Tax=Rhodopila sp. TaxID=2480087 RepID=UPI003D14365C